MKSLTVIILSLALMTASFTGGAAGGPSFRHIDKAGCGLFGKQRQRKYRYGISRIGTEEAGTEEAGTEEAGTEKA